MDSEWLRASKSSFLRGLLDDAGDPDDALKELPAEELALLVEQCRMDDIDWLRAKMLLCMKMDLGANRYAVRFVELCCADLELFNRFFTVEFRPTQNPLMDQLHTLVVAPDVVLRQMLESSRVDIDTIHHGLRDLPAPGEAQYMQWMKYHRVPTLYLPTHVVSPNECRAMDEFMNNSNRYLATYFRSRAPGLPGAYHIHDLRRGMLFIEVDEDEEEDDDEDENEDDDDEDNNEDLREVLGYEGEMEVVDDSEEEDLNEEDHPDPANDLARYLNHRARGREYVHGGDEDDLAERKDNHIRHLALVHGLTVTEFLSRPYRGFPTFEAYVDDNNHALHEAEMDDYYSMMSQEQIAGEHLFAQLFAASETDQQMLLREYNVRWSDMNHMRNAKLYRGPPLLQLGWCFQNGMFLHQEFILMMFKSIVVITPPPQYVYCDLKQDTVLELDAADIHTVMGVKNSWFQTYDLSCIPVCDHELYLRTVDGPISALGHAHIQSLVDQFADQNVNVNQLRAQLLLHWRAWLHRSHGAKIAVVPYQLWLRCAPALSRLIWGE